MSNYDPLKHHRRSIRLKGYDYTKEGCYFITLNVRDSIHLFGKIVDGIMHPNTFGEIVLAEWKKTPLIRKNVSIGACIVMQDHFHAIVHIDYQIQSSTHSIGTFQSPSHTIGAIVRGLKGAITKQVKSIIRAEREKAKKGQDRSKDEDKNRDIDKDRGKGEDKNRNIDKDRGKGEDKNRDIDKDRGKGELQFAPTENVAPTTIDLSKSIWQRDYYERIIRNQKAYDTITKYILNNPKKWQEKQNKKNNREEDEIEIE